MKETNKKLTREESPSQPYFLLPRIANAILGDIEENKLGSPNNTIIKYYYLIIILFYYDTITKNHWSSCELRNGEVEHAGFFFFFAKLYFFFTLQKEKEKSDPEDRDTGLFKELKDAVPEFMNHNADALYFDSVAIQVSGPIDVTATAQRRDLLLQLLKNLVKDPMGNVIAEVDKPLDTQLDLLLNRANLQSIFLGNKVNEVFNRIENERQFLNSNRALPGNIANTLQGIIDKLGSDYNSYLPMIADTSIQKHQAILDNLDQMVEFTKLEDNTKPSINQRKKVTDVNGKIPTDSGYITTYDYSDLSGRYIDDANYTDVNGKKQADAGFIKIDRLIYPKYLPNDYSGLVDKIDLAKDSLAQWTTNRTDLETKLAAYNTATQDLKNFQASNGANYFEASGYQTKLDAVILSLNELKSSHESMRVYIKETGDAVELARTTGADLLKDAKTQLNIGKNAGNFKTVILSNATLPTELAQDKSANPNNYQVVSTSDSARLKTLATLDLAYQATFGSYATLKQNLESSSALVVAPIPDIVNNLNSFATANANKESSVPTLKAYINNLLN